MAHKPGWYRIFVVDGKETKPSDPEIHFFEQSKSLCGKYQTEPDNLKPDKIDEEKNDHCAACNSVVEPRNR